MHSEGASFTPALCGKLRCYVGEGNNGTMSWEQRPAFTPAQCGILNNADHVLGEPAIALRMAGTCIGRA
jgi:hypothetical protein